MHSAKSSGPGTGGVSSQDHHVDSTGGRKSMRAQLKAGLKSLAHKNDKQPSTFGEVVDAAVTHKQRAPSHKQRRASKVAKKGVSKDVLPYVIMVQEGDNLELKGSVDALNSSHLFSKFGLSESVHAKKGGAEGSDMKNLKCEYFTLLERSGFLLVVSTASVSDGRIMREYVFRKNDAVKPPSVVEQNKSACSLAQSFSEGNMSCDLSESNIAVISRASEHSSLQSMMDASLLPERRQATGSSTPSRSSLCGDVLSMATSPLQCTSSTGSLIEVQIDGPEVVSMEERPLPDNQLTDGINHLECVSDVE